MARLLLVGNSRWHWASREGSGLRCWHAPPPTTAPPEGWADLECWSAVGAVPEGLALPSGRRLQLAQVPLRGLPPWLGIDRALSCWQAWRERGSAGSVMVADAGTALSITCVDQAGGFCGGRLSAGVDLQLRSLAEGTARLPGLAPPLLLAEEQYGQMPQATQEAMLLGCAQACAGAILLAWRDWQGLAGPAPPELWLTGGDAGLLEPALRRWGLEPVLAPNLCLAGLAALSSDRDP